MRIFFFIILAVAVVGSGCRRAEVSDYDGLRGELMQEAFALLAAGESARAVSVLERVADLSPEDRFFSLALIREQERQTMANINGRLAAGDLAGAQRALADPGGFGGTSEPLVQVALLHRELTALQAYLKELPFPTSELATPALKRLRERQTLLGQSALFGAWWSGQERGLVELLERERTTEVEQLFLTLDLAVARDDPEAWLLFAQLRVLAPDDMRVRVAGMLLESQHRQLATLLNARSLDANVVAGIEVGGCMGWPVLGGRLRQGLTSALSAARPATLSGELLRALLHAEAGEADASLEALKRLVQVVDPSADRIRELLTSAVLPETQFQAGCWRSPCPSVPDMLQRVRQLRTQALPSHEGTR